MNELDQSTSTENADSSIGNAAEITTEETGPAPEVDTLARRAETDGKGQQLLMPTPTAQQGIQIHDQSQVLTSLDQAKALQPTNQPTSPTLMLPVLPL